MRTLGVATVCASAVDAGIMASSSGSPMATPAPRRNVLRDRLFFVLNMIKFSFRFCLTESLLRRSSFRCVRRALLPKRRALHNTHDDGRKPVAIPAGVAHDLANCG